MVVRRTMVAEAAAAMRDTKARASLAAQVSIALITLSLEYL